MEKYFRKTSGPSQQANSETTAYTKKPGKHTERTPCKILIVTVLEMLEEVQNL